VQRLEFGAHHEKTTVPTILLFPGRGGWQTVVMWKPNWACSTCGMLSSRRYSVQRHIRNLHEGNGIEVSYVDYMEGRLMGIYNPNPYKQQSSSKYNTFFDNFYGATRLNTCSFISSYSNPFMPYSRRSEIYRYPSNYSSSYSDQSYEAVKPSFSSSAQPSEDILRQMTTEFSLELARGLARKLLSPHTSQPNLQSSLIQGGGGNGGLGNPIFGITERRCYIRL
jgi:hypothetical protein